MNTKLGIAFSGNKIFFSELVSENESIRLINIDTAQVDFDFEDSFHKHKSNQKDLTNIASEIQNYISKRGLDNFEAALAISSSQAFTLTIPLDYSEGKQSMNSKIYWELSNYFPDNYNEFVVNTYRLNNIMPCRDSDEFLIIAVLKNTMEFIKRIFNYCRLNLKLVDIDHFSAEYSFREGYRGQLENKCVLLAGIRNGRIDFGIIDNRKYKSYMYSKYKSEVDFYLNISKKLNAIFDAHLKNHAIDHIYLYGDDINNNILEAIKKLDKAPVEILNPFYGVNAAELLLNDDSLRKNAYKYSSACGVALRSFKTN